MTTMTGLVMAFLGAVMLTHVTDGRMQEYKVTGQVFCPSNAEDHKNVEVKLVDEDDGPDPDDDMAVGKTDSQGKFSLSGKVSETSDIEPRLKIYHDCNDRKPCQRKWKLHLPSRFINKPQAYDIGRINLELKMPDEGRNCI